MDEWENAVLDRIKNLKADYSHIENLSDRIRYHYNLTDEEKKAVEKVLIMIRKELERLESELILHRILKGED